MRKPPVCIRCSNPVGRVPARVNLGQLNSSRVIMAHRGRVFDSWPPDPAGVHSRGRQQHAGDELLLRPGQEGKAHRPGQRPLRGALPRGHRQLRGHHQRLRREAQRADEKLSGVHRLCGLRQLRHEVRPAGRHLQAVRDEPAPGPQQLLCHRRRVQPGQMAGGRRDLPQGHALHRGQEKGAVDHHPHQDHLRLCEERERQGRGQGPAEGGEGVLLLLLRGGPLPQAVHPLQEKPAALL